MDPNGTLITRYLLGRLSPQESDRVEEHYLTDDTFFDTATMYAALFQTRNAQTLKQNT
jgi:hypothetical protein